MHYNSHVFLSDIAEGYCYVKLWLAFTAVKGALEA